ncbi:hypothetical protein K469DRAFT_729696 [Zopfia rhizophila CBS 207.26]|uniref:Uncharacterized protein n=1 Tax=Zopfia rhizophila CBS 207.26 TaxID=1314779 RepID=A0A6A6DS17_9PEZI|nr:hypothetical protein K469DRAFT_729696 [Zopfia rhizophila CBS 207.26]
MDNKARGQQYLTPLEKEALVRYLLRMANNGFPIPINRHDKNIYGKIQHWFDIIGEELDRTDVLPENVYNMDKIGVMLSMLSSIKVLVGKGDLRTYRDAGVKRIIVTAIECISADSRFLYLLIIWLVSGYADFKISFDWLKLAFNP